MPTHHADAPDLSAATHGGPDEQERYISLAGWQEALETVADGARLDKGWIHLRAARYIARHPCCHASWAHWWPPDASPPPPCQLASGCTVVVLFSEAIQLPSWSKLWSRTGVLPSALLKVARFDSSLDLVRVPSGSALQQHAPVLRTTSYPYGLAMRPM